jgi:hypothetical protein
MANRVIPIQEFVKIIKQFSAFFVGMKPFLDFSIGLGMLNSRQDMLDIIFREKCIESALRFTLFVGLICEELRAVIGDDLSDPPSLAIILQRLSNWVNACFASCYFKFSIGQNESRTIIEDGTNLFAVDLLVCQSK